MQEEYMALAQKMAESLESDPNILAIMVYGSVATQMVSEGSDVDLLLLVKEMPDDLDMFGIKRTSIEGVPVDLAYKTLDQVLHQIDYEAGSWYSSSVMLNSVILYDPMGEAEGLRKRIRDVPDDRRDFIYKCLMEDARTYPDKIRQNINLRDYRGATYLMRLVFDSLVQVMFMANRTRPASEKGMMRDFFDLNSLPEGLLEACDIVGGFDRIDEERARVMLRTLEESIELMDEFWESRN